MCRLLCLGACLCLVSCSGKHSAHPVYPASGQLLVNGEPAKGARVVFHHVDDWGEESIVPQGMTVEDGRFVLSTYAMRDGAPAGDYRVTVEWPSFRRGKHVGPDRLQKKFSKPSTSGLTAHFVEGPNEVPVKVEIDPADLLPEGFGEDTPPARSGPR
jgi:hypothetical protein